MNLTVLIETLYIASGVLLLSLGYIQGTVTIFPHGIASVCSGDHLELICNTTGIILEWRLNVTSAATSRIYRHGITSTGETDQVTPQLQINSTMFTFSRITNQNEVPLVSRLSINSVNESLNGTIVICEDVVSQESASTTIIINTYTEGVATTSNSIRNTLPDTAIAYCRDPRHQTEDSITVFNYMDPAVPGSSVFFACTLPGYALTGSNTSTCMANGQWDPDPREAIKCKANCGPPSPPPNCHVISYTSTLEGAEATFVCWGIVQIDHPSLCKEVNITAVHVCNKEGNWEPVSGDMCAQQSGSSLSRDGIIAIASSISVFIITSSLFFTFGYLCGHYKQTLNQKPPPSISAEKSSPVYENILSKDHEQKLELKTNVAYAPIQLR